MMFIRELYRILYTRSSEATDTIIRAFYFLPLAERNYYTSDRRFVCCIHRIKSEKGLQFFSKYGILALCNQKPFSV